VEGGGDNVIGQRNVESAGSLILKGGDCGEPEGLNSQLVTSWQMANREEAYLPLGVPLVSSSGGDGDVGVSVVIVGTGTRVGVEGDSVIFLLLEASFLCR
jgi:hypothetical protein